MKNFFERPKSKDYFDTLVSIWDKKLNIKNIDNIKKQKIIALFKPKFEKDFLAYRFDLLKKWMDLNKEYSKEYVVELDDMIEKLCLANELNSWEQQYIKNLQATVFAKNRNLKQLIVDFQLNDNEQAFYRYDLYEFKLLEKKEVLQKIDNPEMYITTQRILISKQIDTISINYDMITGFQYYSGNFVLLLQNNKKCFIISENNRAIVESLKRVVAKEKINLNNDK